MTDIAAMTLAFWVGLLTGIALWDLKSRKAEATQLKSTREELQSVVAKIGEAHNGLAAKVAEHEQRLETHHMQIDSAAKRGTTAWTTPARSHITP